MTTQELRELDAWIEDFVMGTGQIRQSRNELCPHYSTDSAAAMDVLKKCAEKIEHSDYASNWIQIQWFNNLWCLADFNKFSDPTTAETLELSICIFAKQLFSKPTTK